MGELISSNPHKTIGVGVIWNNKGEILIDRRCQSGEMGGLWEFPGGKIEPNETVEECVSREIKEELGIEVAVGDRLITIEHNYETFKLTLFVHHCRYLSGEPQTIECEEVRWIKVEEIDQYDFPQANIKIINILKSAN